MDGPLNVVVVMMDDLAWGDLACHGNQVVRTPRLDGLRRESTRLTRYSSGPLCTPARASLMTGRYHQRTRAIDTFCGRSMLDPGEVTVGEMLRSAGYRTGGFGKWHLGDAYPMRACDLGFEETLMHRSGGIGSVGDHRENYWREGEAYFDPVLQRDGRPERRSGYCTDIFTDAAIDFITRHHQAPFFVYLATNAPHTPLEVPERWVSHYRGAGVNETHARLYGMVENIDWNVGRVLDHLAALGLAGRTLVLYTSDHGPCPSARDFTAPADRQQRFNAGLRGEKGSLYQGAVQVPCFWRWPGVVPAGVDIDRLASPIDVLPTLAAATGATAPLDRVIDGVDLLPLLTGAVAPADWPDRNIFMQWHRGDAPTRYRNYAVITQRYKLHRPEPGPGRRAEEVADELYDLTVDPGERDDLAAAHPDLVAALRAEYERWFDDVGATRPDNYAPPRIHVGSEAEDPTTLSRQDWRVDPSMADLGEVALWRTADLQATWEVWVEREGPYRVEVRLEPFSWAAPKLFTDVVFRADGRSWRTPWAPMCTLFVLPEVELAAGPATVEAWAEGPSGRQAALYVDIGRAPAGAPVVGKP
ncbi:MAG TPA: arylsulfatase [Acidimicrobiales bacterium]|nr:arylsulfatase [Acidimicrobiales bacterium]